MPRLISMVIDYLLGRIKPGRKGMMQHIADSVMGIIALPLPFRDYCGATG
jgi:hypothetical protein